MKRRLFNSGMRGRPVRAALWSAIAAGLLSGCSMMPWAAEEVPDTRVNAVVVASSQVNPDQSGRPSPLVVRIYELRAVSAFNNADYFALADEDKKTLGADLVRRREFEFSPGEAIRLDFEPRDGARYFGVVAAYRNVTEANWRVAVPIPAHRVSRLAVVLQRLDITVAEVRQPAIAAAE